MLSWEERAASTNTSTLKELIPGKKWWYPLFANGLDTSCQNAWPLYKVTKIVYCEYRRYIISYLGRYKTLAQKSIETGLL